MFKIATLLCFAVATVNAQLAAPAIAEIDALVNKTLVDSGTPSVSIAVVKDGKLAFVHAYGNARLDPPVQARPDMRYKIGSVSKQFLSGAILLLVQDGKMSLDDRVEKYLPGLTRGADITIRQLLSHTSGYQDYYPLDFVAPFMQQPMTPDEIINRWARKPLDFEPGTQWQYSNTNYVVAGRVLEKVAGVPLMKFLHSRIFGPLRMKTILDLDNQPMTASDAEGYGRSAVGPIRPAQPEAKGWLFAAGELAMTARDLALWDISLIEKKLLKPASLEMMTSAPRLKNGAPQNYALGVSVGNSNGHPVLAHGGGVSGFTTNNMVWLDQGTAVAVFANKDNSSAPGRLSGQIGRMLLKEELDPQAGAALAQAKQILGDLQQGKVDSSLLTSDGVAYFTPQVIADYAASLKPLGVPKSFVQIQYGLRGGFTFRFFEIGFEDKTLHLSTYATREGKLAQYLINE